MGISPFAQFEEYKRRQLAAQGGVCAICRRPAPDPEPARFWRADHDHACCPGNNALKRCGKCERGILCGSCNLFVAGLEQSPEWTAAALAYLGR